LGREPAGFAEHRIEVIVAEVQVKPLSAGGGKPRRVLESEDDILDRRPVGHGVLRRNALRRPWARAALTRFSGRDGSRAPSRRRGADSSRGAGKVKSPERRWGRASTLLGKVDGIATSALAGRSR